MTTNPKRPAPISVSVDGSGTPSGYARVSPGGKSESVDAQARQLTKAGCKKVFRDVHVSGAKTDRAQLRRVIDQLDAGDVLMVTRLDRLARSTRDLLNTLAVITGQESRIPLAH
jgi:DNA invertase Pin-like site-specific DNA recombinase